jgi:hypothetical protein
MTYSQSDKNKIKALLKTVVWDYNIGEEELLGIFLGNRKGISMSKADLEARLLAYYSWHTIIRALGYHHCQRHSDGSR